MGAGLIAGRQTARSGFGPIWLTFRRNDEAIILDTQLDPVAQPAFSGQIGREIKKTSLAPKNYETHKHPEVKKSAAAHSRYRVRFTPTNQQAAPFIRDRTA